MGTPTDPTISAADTLSRSSSHTTEQLHNFNKGNAENIANGNAEDISNGNFENITNVKNVTENIVNGNVTENLTNGNIDENIANGNVKFFEKLTNSGSGTGKEANINMNIGSNANCRKTLLAEQDSANANLPL